MFSSLLPTQRLTQIWFIRCKNCSMKGSQKGSLYTNRFFSSSANKKDTFIYCVLSKSQTDFKSFYWMLFDSQLGIQTSDLSSTFIHAAWLGESPHSRQCQKVAPLDVVVGVGVLSAAPIDEMKQVNFSFGLRRNEKQMSRRVTESVCVLSARPTWVMALIWPCAPRLFIILRWQGGAGKRSGLGAPSWSITLEVSFPSYLTATWISAALVYRCQPIWMSSRQRKWFLCSLYQSRLVKGRVKKHHVILAHLDVQKDTQTDVNITNTGYSCEKEKGKWIQLRAKPLSFFMNYIFFGHQRQHVLSVYTNTRVDMRKRRYTPMVVSYYSVEVRAMRHE